MADDDDNSSELRDKIRECIKEDDVETLKSIARSKGLPDDVRVEAWTKILDIEDKDSSNDWLDDDECEKSEFYRQVKLDVNRSYRHFPPEMNEDERLEYQHQLTRLILSVLQRKLGLKYYQGFHDVCVSVLFLVGKKKALSVMNAIVKSHLHHFMEETMDTTKEIINLVYYLLKKQDEELYNYLVDSEVGSIFCLSWVITWFSHNLEERAEMNRLFDLFISHHYLLPIYLTTAILLNKRKEILEVQCEMSSMHSFLSCMPTAAPLPLERLIGEALKMAHNHQPEDLIDLARDEQIREREAREREQWLSYRIIRFGERNIVPISCVVCLIAAYYGYKKLDFIFPPNGTNNSRM